MRLWDRVANQTDNPGVAAMAQFNLAKAKAESNPEEAMEWYTRAANQTANCRVAARAQRNLALLKERVILKKLNAYIIEQKAKLLILQ